MLNRIELIPRIWVAEPQSSLSVRWREYLDFVVDGQSLADILGCGQVGSLGAWMSESDESLVRQLMREEPSPSLGEGRVELYVCSLCGDVGCGAESVAVTIDGNQVVWDAFCYENGYAPELTDRESYAPVGPYRFDLDQYRQALARRPATVRYLPKRGEGAPSVPVPQFTLLPGEERPYVGSKKHLERAVGAYASEMEVLHYRERVYSPTSCDFSYVVLMDADASEEMLRSIPSREYTGSRVYGVQLTREHQSDTLIGDCDAILRCCIWMLACFAERRVLDFRNLTRGFALDAPNPFQDGRPMVIAHIGGAPDVPEGKMALGVSF